jgi:G3E family GTPase
MAIKVNVITGFLGVGKTSTIQALMKNKPTNEYWAIIVNEFGEVGIDESLLTTDNADSAIRQIPGGCVCCTVGGALQATLKELITEVKPGRILIEPSGIGHPSGIIDTLEEGLRNIATIQAVITLIDPRNLSSEKHMGHETFVDQIELADILIATKTDLCSPAELAKFTSWSSQLFPPKQQILTSTFGDIPMSLLNEERKVVRKPKYPQAHDHNNAHVHVHEHNNETLTPTISQPAFYEAKGFGSVALGAIFSKDVLFEAEKLNYYLEAIQGVDRVKGVFRTTHRWLIYNRTGMDLAGLFPSAYRKDSRIEIIISEDSPFTLSIFKNAMMRLLEDCKM